MYFTVFRFQWSLACSREVVRFLVTLSATCILLLFFTELNKFTFLSNVLPFPQTNAFDLKRNLTWRFWQPTDKLWRDWHMTEWQILPIPARFPHVAKNIWRIINTIASIWLQKYAQIFVLGHYLLLEAHSFPRASLLENCSLLGTSNVRGQISEHIFAPNRGYCLFIQPLRSWELRIRSPKEN